MLSSSLALFFVAPQAGGGGSFGGGGGGGFGGGGGDGEGLFYLFYWLIRLAIAYPAVGIPLLLIASVVTVLGTQRGWWVHQERVIRRNAPRVKKLAAKVSVDALKRSDPDFDQGRFLSRVREAFQKAQTSWCAQDLEPLRPFVSDGVFERFSLQIEEQKLDGWRQGMEGISVQALNVAHAHVGKHFDSVTVRIPFRADIHRLDRETGRKISGSKLPRNFFAECWTFLRRRGTKTVSGEGLMEGKCPSCAATLEMNQSARCKYCECLARSGQFDWVLVEITQASEWRPEREADLPGFAAYYQRDPGMNVAQLEDRASVAFWRKCAADRKGDVAPLTRLADEAFCRTYAESLGASESGRRTYMADCAVGSVRTLGILAGEERDRAVVEVVWDGLRATVEESGERKLTKPRRLRRNLFVFSRAAGRETPIDEAFTTTHCGNCGAHDPGGTDPSCAYCGAPRTGDASAWLLTGVLAQGSDEARKIRAELMALPRAPVSKAASGAPAAAPVARESAEGLLLWAVALVRADGEVSPKEEKALYALAERKGVSRDRLETLLDGEEQDVPEPEDAEEALFWLAALTELAFSDGSLSQGERAFLRHAGERLGLKPRDRARAIQKARAKLYDESRAAKAATLG